MVLQMQPAKSAIYGFLDFNASMAGAVVQVGKPGGANTLLMLPLTSNAK